MSSATFHPPQSCELAHVTEATVTRLVQEREEALLEVQVLDAENERLRAELKQAYAAGWRAAIECAAKGCQDFAQGIVDSSDRPPSTAKLGAISAARELAKLIDEDKDVPQ